MDVQKIETMIVVEKTSNRKQGRIKDIFILDMVGEDIEKEAVQIEVIRKNIRTAMINDVWASVLNDPTT